MTDFDKTILFLHVVGIGHKVVACDGSQLFNNKLLESDMVKFEEFNGACGIKIGGHSNYKNVDGCMGFHNLIKFDDQGSLVEYGIWEQAMTDRQTVSTDDYAKLKAENEQRWISVDDKLPDVDFGYFLTVRYYHQDSTLKSVQQSFYIKDRDYARSQRKFYSRKTQGKNSVYFDCAESGFVVSHWMPLPSPPE